MPPDRCVSKWDTRLAAEQKCPLPRGFAKGRRSALEYGVVGTRIGEALDRGGKRSMAITKVGIVGGGLLGSGIRQVAAESGYDVMLAEVNQDLLDRGMSRVYGAWEMLAGKGKITREQAEAYRGDIRGTLNIQDFAHPGGVVEALI